MTGNWGFSGVLGQEHARGELQQSIARNRLNHAYLIEGQAGTGRLTLARALAARFLCVNPIGEGDTTDACGTCKHCLLLKAGNHPDYLELPREARELRIRRFVERDGGTEEVNHPPVLEFMRLKPMMEHGRVCVIPDAERMNQEAANAFLKTLEEPPAGSLILLTCAARDRVLGTIVSRCRRVGLSPLPEALVARALEAEGVTPEEARELAALCEGSLGVAKELREGQTREDWRWLTGALAEPTPARAIKLGEEMVERIKAGKTGEEKRREALKLFDLTALCIRRRLREGLDPRCAAAALKGLWQAGERLAANVRPELVIYNAALDTLAAMKRG